MRGRWVAGTPTARDAFPRGSAARRAPRPRRRYDALPGPTPGTAVPAAIVVQDAALGASCRRAAPAGDSAGIVGHTGRSSLHERAHQEPCCGRMRRRARSGLRRRQRVGAWDRRTAPRCRSVCARGWAVREKSTMGPAALSVLIGVRCDRRLASRRIRCAVFCAALPRRGDKRFSELSEVPGSVPRPGTAAIRAGAAPSRGIVFRVASSGADRFAGPARWTRRRAGRLPGP